MSRWVGASIAGCLVSSAISFASAHPQAGGLDAAVEEAQAGRLVSALRAADSEIDPLRRAQARVFVLSRAGDLPGALQAAREGLTIRADDLWLLERICSLAVALRAAELARNSLARTIEALASSSLPAADRSRWEALLSEYSTTVTELTNLAAAQADARRRARWTILMGVGVAVAALTWLSRLGEKKPPQRSVDSQGRPSSPGFS